MSYAIQLRDGRFIRNDGWTQELAERYLAGLVEQAGSEDGMGDDIEEVFGPVLDSYAAILAGAQVVPVLGWAAPLPSHGHYSTRLCPSSELGGRWSDTDGLGAHGRSGANQPRKQLGVQFLGESKRVVVGRVNESQDALVGEMEDATDNAVQAVAEYVIHAFDGALEIEYDDGVTYQIQVVKIGQRRADGGRYGLHPGGLIVGYE